MGCQELHGNHKHLERESETEKMMKLSFLEKKILLQKDVSKKNYIDKN